MFVGRLLSPLVSSVLFAVFASVGSGCSIAPVDGTIDNVFDPCHALTIQAEPGTTGAENDAVAVGIAFWNDRADTRLSVTEEEGAPILPVHFDPAATAFRGLYDDENAVVFVNSRLDDPTVMSITLAHELGHAFGLTHVERGERSSVMNPGNVEVTPTSEDVAALAELWGACESL